MFCIVTFGYDLNNSNCNRKIDGPKLMPTKYLYKLYVVAGFLPHDEVIMQKFIRLCSEVKRKREQKKKGGKYASAADLEDKTILEFLESGVKGPLSKIVLFSPLYYYKKPIFK